MWKRILNVFIGLSLGVFLLESSLWAQTQNQGALFLIEMGRQHLAEGNQQGAISEFSKALMLEPENEEALKQLSLLGIDGGLYDGIQTQNSRITKLASDRVMYQNRADQLEKEKDFLQEKFNQLENEYLFKKKELSDSQETLKDRSHTFQQLSSIQKERIDELNNTITQFQQKKGINDRLNKEDVIEQSLDFWEQNQRMVALDSHVRKSVVSSLDSEKELMALQSRYDGLKQKVDLADFDKNNIFGVLQDYLYVRTHELGVLRDQMVMNEIDLAQNQNNLIDKINEIQNLHKSLESLEEKVTSQESVLQDLGIRSSEGQTPAQKIRQLEEKLQSSVEQMQGMLKERKMILDGIKGKVQEMRKIEIKESQNS